MRSYSHLFFLIILFACNNPASRTDKTDTLTTSASDNLTTKFTIINRQDSVVENGESIQRYKNGVIKMRGMMKNGKRDGLWKSWYGDGTPWSETTFSEGIKNGKTTTWYESGKKRYEGFYSNDKESGKWTYFNHAGLTITSKDYGIKYK
jgi:antitoxin component YwqK of YwqJK toxin-antitoxin module